MRNHHFDLSLWENTPPLAHGVSNPFEKMPKLPLDEPVFTLWDVNNDPEPPKHPSWLTAMQLHDLATDFYLQNEGLPRFHDWQASSFVMSTHDVPTVAVLTTAGELFPLAEFRAECELRVVRKQVPVELRSVTDDQGAVTQIAEAVADDGHDHQWTVSFVRSEDGMAVVVHPTATEKAEQPSQRDQLVREQRRPHRPPNAVTCRTRDACWVRLL